MTLPEELRVGVAPWILTWHAVQFLYRGSAMLWEDDCVGMLLPVRPNPSAPLWHSRQTVKTTGRRRSLAFVEPCGKWHDSHPSTRTGGMFEEERPALVGVASRHGSRSRALIDHPRPRAHPPRRRGRAVRIVAVRARHHAFVHTMLKGHVELRPDLVVAVVAEVSLLLREQIFGVCRPVDRVTIRTHDVVLCVFRSPDLSPIDVLAVALEAVVQDSFGGQFTESDDGRLSAARFDVSLSRTVARFTSCSFGNFSARRNRLIMRVFVKVRPYVRMACLAHCAADVLWGRRIWRVFAAARIAPRPPLPKE